MSRQGKLLLAQNEFLCCTFFGFLYLTYTFYAHFCAKEEKIRFWAGKPAEKKMANCIEPREAMEKLEAIGLKMCPEQAVEGLTELPLIALSGGSHAALVAAALNRHLPLRSFTVLRPGEEAPKALESIVEFLGTTHITHVLTPEKNAALEAEYSQLPDKNLTFADYLLFAVAKELKAKVFYSGHQSAGPIVCGVERRSPLAEMALTPDDYAAMAERYLPCL